MTNTLIAPATLQEYTRTTGAAPFLDTFLTYTISDMDTHWPPVHTFIIEQIAAYRSANIPPTLLELVEQREGDTVRWWVRIRADVELTREGQ